MMAVFDPGTDGGRRAHALQDLLGAGAVVPREACSDGKARALVVNSGNANAFTGKKGREATRMTAEAAAKAAGCAPSEVYIASTGVIGEPLDAAKFAHLLEGLAEAAKPDAFEIAARAIMTTDTYPEARDAHGARSAASPSPSTASARAPA